MNDSPPGVRLLGAADVRALAAELDLRPTKRRGQNFVIDPGTVRRIAAVADLHPGEHVVEVGPGLGSLTLALLEAGARVTAIEIDAALASRLPRTVAEYAPDAAGRLALLHADALRVTPDDVAQARVGDRLDPSHASRSGDLTPAWVGDQRDPSHAPRVGDPACASVGGQAEGGAASAAWGEPTALVANLPYNVAVPVLLSLFERFGSLRRAVVMVQLEVAERLAASPGGRTYGIPSVKAAWYGRVRTAGTIGRAVFWPAPNVDSGLVVLDREADSPEAAAAADSAVGSGAGASRDEVFALVDAAFAARRKTLRAALARVLGGGERVTAVCEAAGIDAGLRAERLTIDDFAALATAARTLPAGVADAGEER